MVSGPLVHADRQAAPEARDYREESRRPFLLPRPTASFTTCRSYRRYLYRTYTLYDPQMYADIAGEGEGEALERRATRIKLCYVWTRLVQARYSARQFVFQYFERHDRIHEATQRGRERARERGRGGSMEGRRDHRTSEEWCKSADHPPKSINLDLTFDTIVNLERRDRVPPLLPSRRWKLNFPT